MNKNELRKLLLCRDGAKCHYCRIECGEEHFIKIWGVFYKTRGFRLEIEHKDNDKKENTTENCVLACPICNSAKSNKFSYEEFKRVGDVIREIWQQKARKLGIKYEATP
ncbi:hypothetical protein ES707_12166 [subsurface metagenome]